MWVTIIASSIGAFFSALVAIVVFWIGMYRDERKASTNELKQIYDSLNRHDLRIAKLETTAPYQDTLIEEIKKKIDYIYQRMMDK